MENDTAPIRLNNNFVEWVKKQRKGTETYSDTLERLAKYPKRRGKT